MARTATAYQGEMLDALVWRAIGGGSASVDAALVLNPGLAEQGPHLAEGAIVILPDGLPTAQPVDLVQLWD